MNHPDPVAIVTGAGRGIGAATAERLAAGGWRLVLVDRCSDLEGIDYPMATATDLERTAAACGGPARAATCVADTRDSGALADAVGIAVDRFGGLDAAVAAAGCIAGGPEAWEIPELVWEQVISVNLEGVWRLAGAAVPALLARAEPRRGRLVAIASAGGLVGLPRLAAYCAAKAGVIGLVRALAAELGPYGVTANCVAPGSTRTAMLDASAAVYDLASPEELARHHLLPRLLEPAEPAALAAWLCSREAAGITGAVLPVDAGMTAR
ncbi:MAG: mycofactocin-coupled SDR family oxidoreductase [Actinomycetota bacterium]|nr:mycofactocin-coupled SDR family oxidoreductase [Actinomycetota bacterium]